MKPTLLRWAVVLATAATFNSWAVAAPDETTPAPPPKDEAAAPGESGKPPRPPGPPRGRRPGRGPAQNEGDPAALLRRVGDKLGVTDAQKEQIRDILEASKTTMKPLMEGMTKERAALRTATQANPVNEEAIRAQSARVASVQADLAVQKALLLQKVRQVLTPEQVQKLQELQASMEKSGRGGFKRMERRFKKSDKTDKADKADKAGQDKADDDAKEEPKPAGEDGGND